MNPMVLGARTLLAMTCWTCGALRSAASFARHPRQPGQRAYIDRRCRACRWRHLEWAR